MPETTNWERNLTLLSSKGRGVLVTLKADGRPQLSNVDFCYAPDTRLIRLSTTDDRAKIRNLRRDPRVSLYLSTPGGGSYAVYEGTATCPRCPLPRTTRRSRNWSRSTARSRASTRTGTNTGRRWSPIAGSSSGSGWTTPTVGSLPDPYQNS